MITKFRIATTIAIIVVLHGSTRLPLRTTIAVANTTILLRVILEALQNQKCSHAPVSCTSPAENSRWPNAVPCSNCSVYVQTGLNNSQTCIQTLHWALHSIRREGKSVEFENQTPLPPPPPQRVINQGLKPFASLPEPSSLIEPLKIEP